jgi:hypothetical protein
VRVVVCLAPFLLAGCSQLLGIQDPSPRDGGPGDDADVLDGGPDPERLAFSFGDFEVARGQTVRLHVTATYPDGGMQDVTGTATYTTDNVMVATFAGPGLLASGNQAGTAMITVSVASASASLMVTVTAAACHPVINELLTEGLTSAADEWVEVLNPCTTAIDVDGWTLNYRGAGTVTGPDSTFMIALTGQMASGELRLFAGNAYMGTNEGKWTAPTGIMGQSSGAVGLRAGPMTTGTLIDSVAYGSVTDGHPFRETSATPTMMNGRSASRLPFDGKDNNNNNNDFTIVMVPTPRALNVP